MFTMLRDDGFDQHMRLMEKYHAHNVHANLCASGKGNVKHYKRRMRLSAKAKRYLGK